MIEGQEMGEGKTYDEREVQEEKYLTILLCIPILQLMWGQKEGLLLSALRQNQD